MLETGRLVLRPWRVAEAATLRELWGERDPRVPPHRRIDAEGRPTVAELEGWIRSNPRHRSGCSWSGSRRRARSSATALAVLDSARSSGRRRLCATVWDWNTASRRVLHKLGFVETDRREADPIRGIMLFTVKQL